ncbi:hypothetical protein FOVSG1_014382 [Fusarium oxysporum f. sp. vasinfectum]
MRSSMASEGSTQCVPVFFSSYLDQYELSCLPGLGISRFETYLSYACARPRLSYSNAAATVSYLPIFILPA